MMLHTVFTAMPDLHCIQ